MGKTGNLTSAYNRLPAVLQDLACTAYGFLVSTRREERKDNEYSKESWRQLQLDSTELEARQAKLLSEMLANALHSTFWKSEFERHGLDVSGNPYAELAKLPIYDKLMIRENAHEIVVGDHSSLLPLQTSGSTGAGLEFFETREAERIRWAYVWRFRQQIGIAKDYWCGYFCGRSVVSPNEKSRFHRFNYFGKQILFSCYHLSKDTIQSYVHVLNKKKPQWIHGYPSFLTEVSFLAMEADLELSYVPQVITTSSENLSSYQEQLIQRFFRSDIRSLYSMAEAVANATQTLPNSKTYVIDETYAYVEFIKHDQTFKIVGTNLTNRAFPLFRYDTGDIASDVNIESFPRVFGGIDGREEDSILLPNGVRVGRLDHVFKEATFVNEAQIVQSDIDSITVKVVKNEMMWGVDSPSKIEQEFRKRIGDALKIRIEIVNKIEKTSGGKLKFVISTIDRNDLLHGSKPAQSE